MNATHPRTTRAARAAEQSAADRRADLERRLDEAAGVIAEALLDAWQREQRERRAASSEGAS